MERYIYNFGDKLDIEGLEHKNLLGNKGANLANMYNLGLPIPCGFTITTDLCSYYYKNNNTLPQGLVEGLKKHIAMLEKQSGKNFNNINPLLLSVRSGACVSMPGMMDTILNLGLNNQTVKYLGDITDNPNFAYDCYIRFLEMFSNIALGANNILFENAKIKIFGSKDEDHSITTNLELKKQLISQYEDDLKKAQITIPKDPYEQIMLAIEAIIKSWNSQRAQIYRRLHNIPDVIGTAVTIQSMVFGNLNEQSCTGVVFSRNPSNGENKIFGEYILKAQGEEIVSGKKTPIYINNGPNSMENIMPKQYNELHGYCRLLENKLKDIQDIEFTVEAEKLYILQARSAKRTANAAIKILTDFVKQGLISKQDALERIDIGQLGQLLHPSITKTNGISELTTGLAASPGAATGRVVFCSEAAELYSKDFDVILLRNETCPEDIKGMSLANGIVTAKGGLTSHAAVVARGMGKPCICGTGSLNIDVHKKIATIKDTIIKEFDILSIDGSTGEIFLGEVEVTDATHSEEFDAILSWANEVKTLKVRANAETITDIRAAINFGAEGIGLCRTEHMFFDPQKISLVRQMIISQSYDERKIILDKILPLHTQDFVEIFQNIDGLPINIRLLDPPLHEFLPKEDNEIEELAYQMNSKKEFILLHLEKISETNPMLGHRGARLGVTHPDIYEMQINAIITAAIKTIKLGIPLNLEIMAPLISVEEELLFLIELIKTKSQAVMKEHGVNVEYKIGTMIELPRAALIADKIAKHVDFFSFGTNDLTQTVYGISRDDISGFLPEYKAANILKSDPFTSLDIEGVGRIITIALEKGRSANPGLSTGICGEHGGDPESIKFFHEQNLDYISCSPYRVPIARISSAQAALK